MALLLGIDTGGTFTDAVLYCRERGVRKSAKALTTREDLSLGIGAAARRVLPRDRSAVAMVSVSTTLATNAIVEGRGAPVCLLMVGQGAESLERSGLGDALRGDPAAFVAGGHDALGSERAPLDEAAVGAAIERHAPEVAAFAVAAHFAVRNAAHECRVRALLQARSPLPVTCSHELSERLDAPRRALTTVLNARLIPMIAELIAAVGRTMGAEGVRAPLMVVKGDGSLVRAELASRRPVETILSGPAASMIGGRHLAGVDDALVVDMGGTTSDIAVLDRGRPRLRDDGASVGGFRTMVRAVAAHSVGLGGDSEVHFRKGRRCAIGPRRVVPMSLLAARRPELLDTLGRRREHPLHDTDQVCLATLVRPGAPPPAGLPRFERALLETLAAGPRWLSEVAADRVMQRVLERLRRRDLVAVCAFTPSDAAHVLGMQRTWSREGARLAAELWWRVAPEAGGRAEPDVESFCRRVVEALALEAGRATVAAALAHEGSRIDPDAAGAAALVERALGGGEWPAPSSSGASACPGRPASGPAGGAPGEPAAAERGPRAGEGGPRAGEGGLVEVALALRRPLVAVGAPAASYFPAVARRLSAELLVPEHAEVANAVGAVAAGVMQHARVLISAPSEGRFRVHAGAEVEDFEGFAESSARAHALAVALAREKARAAGAREAHVEVERRDLRAPGADGREVFLETEITATAFGLPSPGPASPAGGGKQQ